MLFTRLFNVDNENQRLRADLKHAMIVGRSVFDACQSAYAKLEAAELHVGILRQQISALREENTKIRQRCSVAEATLALDSLNEMLFPQYSVVDGHLMSSRIAPNAESPILRESSVSLCPPVSPLGDADDGMSFVSMGQQLGPFGSEAGK